MLFRGTPGHRNTILDVEGILVGQVSLSRSQSPDSGQIRTGVTAILPRGFTHPPSQCWLASSRSMAMVK
ncbi:P1 family peptidase [Hoeflea ulvae]|uniref:P1 family peptidase n=1 Tax=Hoeflea ulvae TaxID=2983764 RepID=A0ABT3YMC6_9HYPH|nr:P1 family peptidase [Hoeflea ulvae]MCY0097040.1 P1 family peptidase [Hoeflea ulvae]